MSNETLDEAGVLAKFGVPPERIVDYLTLVGDAVDNVPGVAKVGPKTAVKWLTQYGSLDGVIAAAADIGGVVGENLRTRARFPAARTAAGHRALRSRTAATANTGRTRAACARSHAHDRAVHALRNEVVAEGSARRADGETPAPAKVEASHFPLLPDLLANDGAHRAGYETILDWPTFERWLAKIERRRRSPRSTPKRPASTPSPRASSGFPLPSPPGEAAYLAARRTIIAGSPGAVAARRRAGATQTLAGIRPPTPRSGRT
jgi:DNA polymerase-1